MGTDPPAFSFGDNLEKTKKLGQSMNCYCWFSRLVVKQIIRNQRPPMDKYARVWPETQKGLCFASVLWKCLSTQPAKNDPWIQKNRPPSQSQEFANCTWTRTSQQIWTCQSYYFWITISSLWESNGFSGSSAKISSNQSYIILFGSPGWLSKFAKRRPESTSNQQGRAFPIQVRSGTSWWKKLTCIISH